MSLVEFCPDAQAALFLGTDWRSFCKGNLWYLFIFGKPDPRHQMLQKKSSAVMIVVIIITDLCHSNPTGVKIVRGSVQPSLLSVLIIQLFVLLFAK